MWVYDGYLGVYYLKLEWLVEWQHEGLKLWSQLEEEGDKVEVSLIISI